MANMLSPGVYVSEADFSDYVSESSTCIVGMVGGARRGPVGVPTLVTSQAQMVEIFGEPVEGEYGVYSALAALTRASQLYYTRVVNNGDKAEAVSAGIVYTAAEVGTSFNGIKVVHIAETTTETVEEQEVTTPTGLYTIKIFAKDANVESATPLESYTNVSLDREETRFIEKVINGVSNYVTVTLGNIVSLGESLTVTLDNGVDISYGYATAEDNSFFLRFRSKYYDSTIEGYRIEVTDADNFGFFNVALKKVDGTIVENYPGVNIIKDSDRYVASVINNASTYVTCTVNEALVPTDTNRNPVITGTVLTFTGGSDGIDGISKFDIIGQADGTGLYSFSNDEVIDIDLLAAPGWYDPDVISAGIDICENRGECLYIADTPSGKNAQEILDWSNGNTKFDSSFAALYWPWVQISDSYTKKNIWLPPSGYVIAQYAYNDAVAFPWSAPAGINRGSMAKPIAIEVNPTRGERDALYGNRNVVNVLTNFLGNGIVIWGQKTMQRSPSAVDRVNVRRLINYLKKSIGSISKRMVFEQNSQSTWNRWAAAVEPILSNVKSNDGIYEYRIDVAPSDSNIENGILPVSVSIKPTKTAEFIPLTFNIMSYGASFED